MLSSQVAIVLESIWLDVLLIANKKNRGHGFWLNNCMSYT